MSTPKASKHFIRASNLMAIVFVLSIIYLFLPNISIMTGMLPVVIGSKALVLFLVIALRMGYTWSKFILIAFSVFLLVDIPHIIEAIEFLPLPNLLSIVQLVLTLSATVIVFRK